MSGHALTGIDGFVKRNDFFTHDPQELYIIEGFNPRRSYGDEKDLELKESIREHGVQEPLRVQKIDGKLYIRNGHRRKWCCDELLKEGIRIAGVPVILLDKKTTDENALVYALNTDTQKAFDPLEVAEAYQRLINYKRSVAWIAQKVGKSVTHVYNRLNLINATAETREAIKKGEVGISDASKVIASSGGNPERQKQAIRKVQQRKNKVVIKWDKKTKCLVGNDNLSGHENLLAELMPTGFTQKLEAAGLDPETFRLSVSLKPSE